MKYTLRQLRDRQICMLHKPSRQKEIYPFTPGLGSGLIRLVVNSEYFLLWSLRWDWFLHRMSWIIGPLTLCVVHRSFQVAYPGIASYSCHSCILNDNTFLVEKGQPGYDPLHKLGPVYKEIVEQYIYHSNYKPHQQLSLDEDMVPWRGNLLFRKCKYNRLNEIPVVYICVLWNNSILS